jgi:hypothetical protein
MAERNINNDSSDAESELFEVEDTAVPSCKRIKTTHVGAGKYRSKFKSEWGHMYPVKAVKNDLYSFHCIPCMKNIKCDHQGITDVKNHCGTESHKKREKQMKSQPSVSQLFHSQEPKDAVTKAEVIVTNFLIQHNLPLATSDHLGPLFRSVFPDSDIAKKYSCGRTKTCAIVNKAMGPHCHEYVVKHCLQHPFSLGIDGSSDTDVEKMNPMTVRIFDINRSKTVTTQFYDMCVTSGRDASKAEQLFEVVQTKMAKDEIPWSQAVSLSVDNTNSMIGAHNSFASRCKAKNPDIYVLGCPCHLAHIAASNANDAFTEVAGINVEDLLIDLYYWFDKSTKRKGVLVEYMEFCDQEYGKILKHSSTRWLSLERCVERVIKKYAGLKSYFLSENFADARFQRLRKAFENPVTEMVLFFHHASIPLFTSFNKLLQSDEPCIHIVHDSVVKLGKTLGNRIIKTNIMKESPLTGINLEDQSIYIPVQSIHLGGMTKFNLRKLLNERDITERTYNDLFVAAQAYFKAALGYVLKKFPLTDEVLKHAKWINVQNRSDAKWESVEFFWAKFKSVSNLGDTGIQIDAMYDEFCDYQTLTDDDIGEKAWSEAKVVDGLVDGEEIFHHRVDVLWWYISDMVVPGCSKKRFCYLAKVAEPVLILHHSNAGEERLFSMVRKNKTDSRSSMKLDGTLSNLMSMKLHYPETTTPCHKWNPEEELLKNSKKATKVYNLEHKNK